MLGWLTGAGILPGLPIAALAACCPGLAAIILTKRNGKGKEMALLLRRLLDWGKISQRSWYLPIILTMPLIMAMSFVIIRFTGDIPTPQLNPLNVLMLCMLFFIAATAEELGWSAYALDKIPRKWGVVRSGLVLGAVWALVHFIPLLQAHRSIVWIAWWSLGTVAYRTIMVWLYNNAGRSVFAMALFHMTINVTWQLFPVNGSYYNPAVTSVVAVIVAIAFLIIPRQRVKMDVRY
jgi:membrane protease YdiL (CAAX protease family)